MSEAYDFVQHLAELAPVFTAAPTGDKPEFRHPDGWSKLTVEGNAERIESWQPGDALAGLMGDRVAVVDVDPRNGGDVEKVRAALDGLGIRVYAEVLTPSGGWHLYTAGHAELATCHKLTGFPGVDVQSFGAVAYLPGTQRPKYDGAGYVVVRDDLETLADGGDPTSGEALAGWVATHRTGKRAEFETSEPWTGKAPDARQAAYLAAVLRNSHERIAGMRPDSGRNAAVYEAGLACGNYIAGAGMDEAEAVRILTDAATACGLVADDGERSVLASIRSGIRNGKVRPRAVPDALPTPSTVGRESTALATLEERRAALGALLDSLREWQHLPDPTHIVAALAAAATRHGDGEPCWLLLVAPPSSGKTEAVRVLDDTADARLDEVTAAGLLGWSKGKSVRPSGVLSRVGTAALVTLGDLSGLLATSDRGGRDQVFALLRRAYDGHVTRDISPPGKVAEGVPEALRWSGRLTVVACVTGAIDRYTAHADQLGARWVYVRLPDRDTGEKRRASALARRGNLTALRHAAREAATALLDSIGDELPPLPDEVADTIEDAALVTAWGRGAVPRNGYGRRDIEGVPVVEEPMRLVQQLGALARGVLALGLPEEAAASIARRVALDSMPEARRAVLAALGTGELLTTSGVARAAGIHRHVARFQLEELAAIGVVEHDRQDDEGDELLGAVHWSLSGNDGALIADVFSEHKRNGGWHEMLVYTSTSPPEREEETPTTGGKPTLRATKKPAPLTYLPDHPRGCTRCGTDGGKAGIGRRGLCVDCEAATEHERTYA